MKKMIAMKDFNRGEEEAAIEEPETKEAIEEPETKEVIEDPLNDSSINLNEEPIERAIYSWHQLYMKLRLIRNNNIW
jgi:hypothetical protein